MRLICPNCDAQYEVVDDVIPVEGRDVQCSNCGQTWFQHHPDHMPEQEEEGPELVDVAPDEDQLAADEEPVEAPVPKRRELDPDVADILREEAELESQARATEVEALESQPDLGLDTAEADTDKRSREARERMAKMRGEETGPDHVSEEAATAAAIASRRDLLPDIDEINSTLRSTNDREGNESAQYDELKETAQAKSGFRRGFLLMVLLAVILLAVYVFAPAIAQSVPQADPFLNAYVAQVDNARVWLDGQVAAGLTWLDNLTATEGE
ncbi:MAG: MJ0042-type zinc finger domain-containing protein [Pseudomonadota bacterium]